jgi:hypothetical protein
MDRQCFNLGFCNLVDAMLCVIIRELSDPFVNRLIS